MDTATFNTLLPKPHLEPCCNQLYAYQSDRPIPVLGQFATVVRANGHEAQAQFKVVEGQAGNLLSFDTARELDLFSTDAFRKKIELASIGPSEREERKDAFDGRYEKLANGFSDVFTDRIGLLKDHPVRLHVDKSVQPLKSAYRRQPFHLVKAIDKELDRMLLHDIIEPVEGPVDWLSQLVVVPKKQPGQVRLTTDMAAANRAIKRINFASPTLQEIAYDMRGAAVLLELDLRQAFYQFLLADEDSRHVTAFETHRGIFRFKRLPMGANVSMELMQHAIRTHVLQGLKGTRGIADNLIVWGRDPVRTSMITARDEDGATITRDASRFKRQTFEGPADNRVDAGLGIAPSSDPIATETALSAPNTVPTPGTTQEEGDPRRVATGEPETTEPRRQGRPIGSTNATRALAQAQSTAYTATTGEEKRYPTRDRKGIVRFQAG
ncbi:Retrovirus-related Pol poly from transposon, partial [Brachionus plicatilis]